MGPIKKIYNLEQVKFLVEQGRKLNKKIVLCNGHYNVIHPGHLRFLDFAKSKGDILIASVQSDEELKTASQQVSQPEVDSYFTQEERARGVAGLEIVSGVYLIQDSVLELISEIMPDFYIKGREFEEKQETIKEEISAVKRSGGKVVFSSGDLAYSRLNVQRGLVTEKEKRLESFQAICNKYGVDIQALRGKIKDFRSLSFLVVGDTIVDQFVGCDALGVSSEAPVLAIRELNSQQFAGGAAIVAKHLRSLGAEVDFVSVIGKDEVGKFVRNDLNKFGVNAHLVEDCDRPTTFKIRYMVEEQKILRVSRLKQSDVIAKIEEKVLKHIAAKIEGVDGVIVSDFVYGVITNRLLENIQSLCQQHKVKLFGDLQCSSQIGDVSKFTGFDLITPTEKEARIALADQTSGLERLARDLMKKTECKNLAITLGSQGVLNYTSNKGTNFSSEFFPALESHAVDVAGAGDTMLAGYALGLTSGLNIFESSALGSCLAAIAVSRIGNVPIGTDEIDSYLERISDGEVRMLI